MEIEKIQKHINYLKNDKYSREFYVALLLYDILDIDANDVTEEMANNINDIQDEYDSIYNEDMRDRIRDEYEIDLEEDLEEEFEEELDLDERDYEK